MNLSFLEVTLISLLGYLIVITLSGYFQAWVAKSFGDSTLEYAGMLSLNPVDHIDPIGLIFLFLVGFGWGRHVPINPYFISEPHHTLKVLIASLAKAIANIALALGSLIILMIVFGASVLEKAVQMMVYSHTLSLKVLTLAFPEYSSISLVFAAILVSIVAMSILLAVLNVINVVFRYFMMNMKGRSVSDFVMFLLPCLMIFFLMTPMRILLMKGIFILARSIGNIIG